MISACAALTEKWTSTCKWMRLITCICEMRLITHRYGMHLLIKEPPFVESWICPWITIDMVHTCYGGMLGCIWADIEFILLYCRQFNESRAMHTTSPSPYSPSPTRRSLSPSPAALLAPSGTSAGFAPPSPLRGRTQSFGSTPQGSTHSHHHAHGIHSSSTTSLPTRSNVHPTHSTSHAPASLQQVREGRGCVCM